MKTTARLRPLTDFVRTETGGATVLLVATALALLWANSSFASSYATLWGTELTIGWGDLSMTEDLQHWVNDCLMAIFFFVVGLEVKRELVKGELRDPRAAALPVVAASIGLALPAAIGSGIGLRPIGIKTSQLAAVAPLAGVGFTVSLFISDLAFEDAAMLASARIGVLVGSFLSAVIGAALLLVVTRGVRSALAKRSESV